MSHGTQERKRITVLPGPHRSDFATTLTLHLVPSGRVRTSIVRLVEEAIKVRERVEWFVKEAGERHSRVGAAGRILLAPVLGTPWFISSQAEYRRYRRRISLEPCRWSRTSLEWTFRSCYIASRMGRTGIRAVRGAELE